MIQSLTWVNILLSLVLFTYNFRIFTLFKQSILAKVLLLYKGFQIPEEGCALETTSRQKGPVW